VKNVKKNFFEFENIRNSAKFAPSLDINGQICRVTNSSNDTKSLHLWPTFVYFFHGKFRGNFRGYFPHKKVSKNRFPKKFRGKFRGKSLSAEKMCEKSAPDLSAVKWQNGINR
jgi:hypothetical protein